MSRLGRRLAADALERWWVVTFGRWRWGRPQAGWSGSAGDAGGCGDVQGAVGVHDEPPAAGEGLHPVVATAETTQVGAGGRAVAGVLDHVVQVGPADALSAVGHPTGAVAGGHERLLPAGR